MLLIYVGLIGLTGFGFSPRPRRVRPQPGQGLPAGQHPAARFGLAGAHGRGDRGGRKDCPGDSRRDHTVGIPGQSFVLNAVSSNYGSMFVILKPFHERQDAALSGDAIAARLRERLQREVPEARVLVFGPPAVRGLGNAGGFKLMVEATGDVDFDALQAQADNLAAKGNQQPGLVGLFNGFRARTPQLYVDIDRTKVKTMGVELNDVFDCAAGVPGQLLRQRLQPLRPHLAGERSGRRSVPRGCRHCPAAQGPQRRRRRGAAGRSRRSAGLRRAGAGHAVQHVPGGGDQRRLAARRQHRRGPGDHGASWRKSCRAT